MYYSTHNYSGKYKSIRNSPPVPAHLSRQTMNNQETKKINSKTSNVKKDFASAGHEDRGDDEVEGEEVQQ